MMRPTEIQQIYLEIQSRLGTLLEDAPQEHTADLRKLSVNLCRIKRRWIGTIDEIEPEVKL